MRNDKNAFGISKRSHLARLSLVVVRNQTWKSKWKKQIDKTNEWVAW
jgi:hypothetical protein